MSKKLLYGSLACLLFSGSLLADSERKITDKSVSLFDEISGEVDGFLNIKAAHERSNRYAFGPKNTSALGLNPVVSLGNFTFDTGLYYGRQFSYAGILFSERNLSRMVPGNLLKEFRDSVSQVRNDYKKALGTNTTEAHFYREYTRLLYENKENNFRVVVGDTTTKNQIGNQHAIVGAGISIFRQSGNGSSINSSNPIVLTRPSKVECRLGDDILTVRVFAPGTYYLDDLPEEAKIPGVTVKITDQLNRSETLTVDYFSGYGMLKQNEDDFDLSCIYESYFELDDPYRVQYRKSPRISGNYRRGLSDDLTIGVGAQAYKNTYSADLTTIHATEFGKISPNFSITSDSSNGLATAAGIYYCTPVNEYGVTFEAFFGAKEKGFSDLRRGEELGNMYNKFMNKYFSNDNLKTLFKNSGGSESSRQIIARIYTKPIFGFIPTFTFNGEWSKSSRLREYTLSCTTKLFDRVTFTASAGLTYDDPHKGVNNESPDRRLTVALTIPVGDFKVQGTYSHHDDERLRSYANLEYHPSEIPGLELSVEDNFKPGFSNPVASVKYDGEHFGIKVEESITNEYPNSAGGRVNHDNRQRAYFGTSISPTSIKGYRKSSVNVLRTAREKSEK